MLKRLPLMICAVVALDFLLLGICSYWLGWKMTLAETGLTSAVGVVVILYYQWRWSDLVAKRIESESATLDAWSVEKILLLVAGLVILIPGVLTDLLGLFMLVPGVRRTIVAYSNGAPRSRERL